MSVRWRNQPRARSGRPHRRARTYMFAAYGTTCYICGHPGATEAGHIEAVATNPNQPADAQRMRPVHGTTGPCERCGGRACNQEQGVKRMDEMFRPKLVW